MLYNIPIIKNINKTHKYIHLYCTYIFTMHNNIIVHNTIYYKKHLKKTYIY